MSITALRCASMSSLRCSASAVREACANSPDCYPDDASWDPLDIDGATTLPAYTFHIAVDVAYMTYCAPPAPAAVPIPVTPLGV